MLLAIKNFIKYARDKNCKNQKTKENRESFDYMTFNNFVIAIQKQE